MDTISAQHQGSRFNPAAANDLAELKEMMMVKGFNAHIGKEAK
jgi:hypothetical protein